MKASALPQDRPDGASSPLKIDSECSSSHPTVMGGCSRPIALCSCFLAVVINSLIKERMNRSQSPYKWLSRLCQPTAPPLQVSWVLPGTVALGRLPGHRDGAILAAAGIQVVLSLCGEAEGRLSDAVVRQFDCQRIVLPDSRYAERLDPKCLSEAVLLIHQTVQAGRSIYVHCLAGVERSPTVVLAYLCQYHRVPLWQALQWVQQVHPAAHPTAAQLGVIQAIAPKIA